MRRDVIRIIKKLSAKREISLIPNLIITNGNNHAEEVDTLVRKYHDVLMSACVFKTFADRGSYYKVHFSVSPFAQKRENPVFAEIKVQHPLTNSFPGVLHFVLHFRKEDLTSDDVSQLLDYVDIHSKKTRFVLLCQDTALAECLLDQLRKKRCSFLLVDMTNTKEDDDVLRLDSLIKQIDPAISFDCDFLKTVLSNYPTEDRDWEFMQAIAYEIVLKNELYANDKDEIVKSMTSAITHQVGFRA